MIINNDKPSFSEKDISQAIYKIKLFIYYKIFVFKVLLNYKFYNKI